MEDGRWSFASFGLRLGDFGLEAKPRFQVLVETFLRLQIVRDDDDGPRWEKLMQQGGEERLRGHGDVGKKQRSASLQSPGERLHGGSLRDVSEQIACR